MSSQKPVKHLVIEMEFTDMNNFDFAMEHLRKQVRTGVQESKIVRDHLRIKHGMCYLNEFDCRIENINGVECIIIPSKMNQL